MFRSVAIATLLACAASAAGGAEPPLRDPMQPFAAVAAEGGPGATQAPRFRLTAVVISSARRVAVINGKAYQSGERVAGAEVVSIEPKSVALRDGEEQWVVHLGKRQANANAVKGDSGQ